MKKKIFTDMLLNILASAIPLLILQLWILPSLGEKLSESEYGLIITILSFINIFPAAMGNVLNNVRLLHSKEKINNKEERDFNVILFILTSINVVLIILFSFFFNNSIAPYDLLLNVVTAMFFILHGYYCVAFLLNINYVYILISNLFLSFGYVLGYLLFLEFRHWQYIYIIGYLCSGIFIFLKSSLWKEPFKISEKIKIRSRDTAWFILAGILARTVEYADRLILFPILGGAAVSIYYVATLFSKVVSMASSPINGVILTYLSKTKEKKDSVFRTTVLLGLGFCIIGYGICVICAKPVLRILYPKYVMEAIKYIYITTGIAVTSAFISILSPFIIRFFSAKCQVVISGITAFLYVSLSFVMIRIWGLYGLCFGSLVTNIFRILFMVVLYQKGKTREDIQKA